MRSRSPNEVLKDIEEGIKKGTYKNCVHLLMIEAGFNDDHYRTGCSKNAFDQPDTQHHYHVSPHVVTCPGDCRLFEDKGRAERAEKWRKISRRVGYRFSRIWEGGVMRFHWTERILVLVILLFFVLYFTLPSLVPQFIELIKALRGS